jgi:ubiquinol-cytochrome c reductase cytochrome b subunit/menaquinol-cytochrome c reductase cytochrome b/c subunit
MLAGVVLVALLLGSGCGHDDRKARTARDRSGPVDVPGDVKARPGLEQGRRAFLDSGCLGCHRLGVQGNAGPGPDLSRIGSRLDRGQLARILRDPPAPMPSYFLLERRNPAAFRALVDFLAAQK